MEDISFFLLYCFFKIVFKAVSRVTVDCFLTVNTPPLPISEIQKYISSTAHVCQSSRFFNSVEFSSFSLWRISCFLILFFSFSFGSFISFFLSAIPYSLPFLSLSLHAVLLLQNQSFPHGRNGFKVGMRLEGIDPLHPSMFCVLSVAEVSEPPQFTVHFWQLVVNPSLQ